MHIETSYARGSALIAVLVLLMVLTLLILNASQSSILESRLCSYFRNKNLAFVSAEEKLSVLEQKIKSGLMPKGVEMISDHICGVKFYRVTASGRSNQIMQTVQSTFAILGDQSKCKVKPQASPGRQSWRGLSLY